MKVFKAISAVHEDILVREVNKLGIKQEDIQQIVFSPQFGIHILYYWGEKVEEDINKKYEEVLQRTAEEIEDESEDYSGNA